MSGYIKADVLRKEYNDWYKLFLWGDGTDAEKATIARAIQILNEQPIVDAVEVVRCKNCEYRFKNKWFCADGRCLEDEQFCGYGERREDDKE